MSDLLNASCMSSGAIAASGSIKATPGKIFAVTLVPAAATSNAWIRDGGAGGTIKWQLQAPANGASESMDWPNGLVLTTDIYVELLGAGATVYIAYL